MYFPSMPHKRKKGVLAPACSAPVAQDFHSCSLNKLLLRTSSFAHSATLPGTPSSATCSLLGTDIPRCGSKERSGVCSLGPQGTCSGLCWLPGTSLTFGMHGLCKAVPGSLCPLAVQKGTLWKEPRGFPLLPLKEKPEFGDCKHLWRY